MNKNMDEYIKMSKFAGMREDLVQAGGGNSSVKLNKNVMNIKSSGIQLADISKDEGYATVNPEIIVNFFDSMDIIDITKAYEEEILNQSLISGGRPSIETFLHAITDIYTLHTHPMLVNVLTARKDGMNILGNLFPEALLVDYATPGIELAKEYFLTYKKMRKDKNEIFQVIFLKNHGLIVSGKTGEEVINKTEEVVNKIACYLEVGIDQYKNVTKLYSLFCNIYSEMNDIVYLSDSKKLYECAKNFKDGLWNHYFAPDCIVYCGRKFLVLNEEYNIEYIENHIKQYGKPIVILLNKYIYIVAQSIKKAKEIESVLSFSAQVAELNTFVEMDLINDTEQNFLLNWEAEKYRQNIKVK